MDGYEFQDLGCFEPSSTQLGNYTCASDTQQPWSPALDAPLFGSSHYYGGMLSSDRILNESYVDWPNLQTSAWQFEGHGVSESDAALQYAMNGTREVDPESNHIESSLIDTGVRYLGSVGESSDTVSTHFTPQQSKPRFAGQKCVIDSCEFHYTDQHACKDHMKHMHQDASTCSQCMYVGKTVYEVGLHASSTGHASFACKHDGCEKKFARLDTYQRHQRTHREDAERFPCKYCKKYRGKNGFKRGDHLTQHIRNYHHIGEDKFVYDLSRKWCPKKGCTESKPDSVERVSYWTQGVFHSPKEWFKHMRTVHDESEFPCPQPGCDRINGKGYFRPADLRIHLRKVHGTDGSFDQSIQHDLSG